MPPYPDSVTRAGDTSADERGLRHLVRSTPGLAVLTGGQTGVDTLAARAALRADLPVHLVFPKGYRQEDGNLTRSRRRALTGASLHALSSASFRYRTWTAVYLADAVILLDPAGGAGCQETARAASRLGRPLLASGPGLMSGAGLVSGAGLTSGAGLISGAQVAAWLDQTGARVLMVAGCRASLLASAGKTAGLRVQLAAIAAGASARHARLLGTSANHPDPGPSRREPSPPRPDGAAAS